MPGQWVYYMKRNKVLKNALIILGVLIVLLAAFMMSIALYLRHMTTTMPTLPGDTPSSTVQVTLTDEEVDKLLSGEITLDELTSQLPSADDAGLGAEADAAASVSQSASSAAAATVGSTASSSSADSTSSSKQEQSTSSKPAASSSSTNVESASSSAASSKTEQPYETEVKALLQQLYAAKARAEAELNACVAGAKAEYKALPASQQTQARKISIVLSRSSQLYSMQAAYDKEVEGIVSQMRAVLTANGQSTALADQAMASYKAQKSATYSQLMAKLYS